MEPSIALAARCVAPGVAQPPVSFDGRSGQPEYCRRPLYLCARVKARVDADGAALRVRSSGRCEARYPLYRVSRVIASNRVDWSAAALEACLQSGIPIVIVAGSGVALGLLQPAHPASSRLSEDMDELLDREDWREIYGNWLRATRMRILREWRTARAAAGGPLDYGEFTDMVKKYVYGPANPGPVEQTVSVWRAALVALAATGLHHAGLQPVHWGAGGTPLNLLDDLARVLELGLRIEVRGNMGQELNDEALALKVFHAVSEKLDAQCARIVLSLARRLKQVLAEWR